MFFATPAFPGSPSARSIDEIVGVINLKDFYNEVVQRNASWPVLCSRQFVAASTKLNTLMSLLQQKRPICCGGRRVWGTLG